MNLILTYAKLSTKRMFRDRTAMFFVFLFPIIFLVVFGLIFRGSDGASFDVAVFNRSSTELSTQFVDIAKKAPSLKVVDVAGEDEAKEKLSRSEISGYIIIPEQFGQSDANGRPSGELVLRYSQGNDQTAQALGAYMNALVGALNQSIAPYSPPFTVKSEAQNIIRVSRFDATLSGLLGFSLMSLGIFGVVNGFVGDKKTGAVGRLRVTPLKAWQLIIASALNRIVIAVVSVALMLTVSALIFGFRMQGNWPSFIIVTILGSLMMFGIGLSLGGWAKSEEQAAPLANLVTFPMMFLSGVFFPTYIMPQWLQEVSKFIPLTPVVDSFRQILTEGRTVFDLGPQLLVIVVWGVLAYVLAGKLFRWE